MICLSLNTELAKIDFFTEKKHCLRELGNLYKKCMDKNSNLSDLILGLFYIKEASLYEGENAIKELKAILADLNDKFSLIYKVELELLLVNELKQNDLISESQTILYELDKVDKSCLNTNQIEYIQKNLVINKDQIVLKGKELALYTTLETGPCDKFDLIFIIYGEDCDISKAERSFKTLLNRLRKKIDKEIILNTKQLYELH